MLDKLDSNISKEVKESMKKAKAEAEEFEKEIRRYLNGNTELRRELESIEKMIPDSSFDFKN